MIYDRNYLYFDLSINNFWMIVYYTHKVQEEVVDMVEEEVEDIVVHGVEDLDEEDMVEDMEDIVDMVVDVLVHGVCLLFF